MVVSGPSGAFGGGEKLEDVDGAVCAQRVAAGACDDHRRIAQRPPSAVHQYHVSGILRVQSAEGDEFDATEGQVTALPAGHDAWVIGTEPVVVIDWWGA